MSFKDWWYKLKGSPFADVIKHKHRFVVMDTDTFKEKFSFQLSGINLFVTVGITIIVLILLTTVLIAFTPMREWIPGYTNNKAIEQIYDNAKQIDSLQIQLENQEWMVATLQAVLRGETMGLTPEADSIQTLQEMAVVYRRSKEDSLLRAEVETEDNRYQVKNATEAVSSNPTNSQPTITQLFYTPLKGKILTSYSTSHPGVDVGSDASHAVCAAYNGTVVFAGFTAEKGLVLAVQHPGNVVTVYQNCGSLLRQQGNVVRAGEPIAYVGSSGKSELGPYLHFELWVNGVSVNPVDYFSF